MVRKLHPSGKSKIQNLKSKMVLPFRLRVLIVLASFGLHGLLLMLPLYQETKPQSQKLNTVQISQLPKSSLQPSLPQPETKHLPESSSKINDLSPSTSNLQPISAPTPKVKPKIKESRSQDLTPPQKKALKKVGDLNSCSRTVTRISGQTEGKPSIPCPAFVAQSPRSLSTLTPKPNQPTSPSVAPFDDFPFYPQAQMGSCGLLKGAQDVASFHTRELQQTVARYFEQELSANGYEKQDVSNNMGIIYQVSKGGTRKYLNLIPCLEQGTAIALTSEPLNLKMRQNVVTASESEALFDRVLVQLKQSGEAIIPSPEIYFNQPGAFYGKSAQDPSSYDSNLPHSGFNGNFVYRKETSEELIKTFFKPRLSGFTVDMIGDYGDGKVYAAKQGTFIRYLNLVPAKGSRGTLVLVWDRPPS